MASDTLSALQALDIAVLTDVVRQDQQEPSLEVIDWTVAPLSTKGLMNPEGLFLFSGQARAGETAKPWSVVLKILRKPEQEQEPHEMWYWKRELSAIQSGLLARLPGPVVAPRFYGATEYEDSAWIWMEHIHDATGGLWTLDHYAFAARQLGRFNGTYVTGMLLPFEPWLCRRFARQLSEFLNPEHAWENPFVRRYFSPDLRTQVMQLWTERERFYNALDRLPQVFSHFDYMRRNLFIRHKADGQQEVVAIDWAWCGIGPVGGDLYSLVGTNCALFEWNPSHVLELEEAVFEPYLAGLRDMGWDGDPELVRLGYAAWIALHCGVATPGLTAFCCTEERLAAVFGLFGRSLDEAASGWAEMCEFSLSRDDEARKLMAELLPDLG
jgi:hypothetical protein